MATLSNRSQYTVRVPRHADLTRSFSHENVAGARQYLKALREQGYAPRLEQGNEHWYVRVRKKGYPEQNFDAGSLEVARAAAARIEGERRNGLFTDYTKGHRVTFAELIERYIEKVCPRHKSCEIERTILESLLTDLGGAYAERALARKRERAMARVAGTKKKPRILPPRHTPRAAIEWLQRPIAKVEPEDINKYLAEREEQGLAPATIDREIDLLSQVITYARKTERVHMEHSPLYGVIRPGYFNERDRRLVGDEQERLFAAAREEDRLLAIETALAPHREQAARMPCHDSTRKRFVRRARTRIEADPAALTVIPYYEAFIFLLLETAARRSELLGLLWANVNFESSSGYLPDIKNGRARSLVLRTPVLEMLKRLPRTGDRIFPLSVNAVREAWYQLCTRAGLTDFHMHDLRHTALTVICETARRAGVPLNAFELASISGHRDLRSLARYLNLCTGELAERIDEAHQIADAHSKAAQSRKETSPFNHKGRPRARIRVSAGALARETRPALTPLTAEASADELRDAKPANRLPS